MKKQYVLDTMGKIVRDHTSYGHQFQIDELEVPGAPEREELKKFVNQRVRVIVLIDDEEA